MYIMSHVPSEPFLAGGDEHKDAHIQRTFVKNVSMYVTAHVPNQIGLNFTHNYSKMFLSQEKRLYLSSYES